ncbi:MAG: 16S rRNA (guanine(527)-N(7))-methyltransferase RsmG [Verrucomicrobiota bacterium]|nr:16S rRNA (guanine(527)-N(7))-methyltransferase RsmG [Verrucomicrobiota bacterium]
MKSFSEFPKKLLKDCGVRNIPNFIAKVDIFYNDLVEENKKFNLTRITDKEDFWIKHIIDSLHFFYAFPEIREGGKTIADIGSGAGIPLIPLAIAFSNNFYTAFESRQKKTGFINKEIKKLSLKNCIAQPLRACEAGRKKEFNEKFDIITARAVATLPKLYQESKQLLKRNGKMIFYKTPERIPPELKELLTQNKKLKNKITISGISILPSNAGKRQFVTIF